MLTDKIYRHEKNYFAVIRRDGDLYIGKGLSKSAAVKRLKKSKDTRSVSKHQAKVIAGLANPSGSPKNEGDRKDGKPRKGRYYHWHPYKKSRMPMHSMEVQ